jgi:hypothetical protein
MLLDPNGPKTLDAVINDDVAAVPSNDPVNDEADTGPIAVKDPVTITLPVYSNVFALIKKSLADDAVVAREALKTLFEPNGPKTLDAVTNDDVAAVPSSDPVNEEADTDPDTDRLPVTSRDPVIVWLPINVFDPVVANIVEFNPSNKSALFAYEAVNINDAVDANEALVEPLA